jgi:epoxyqueuosine reductase
VIKAEWIIRRGIVESLNEMLFEKFEQEGFKAKVISIDHIKELENDITELNKNKLIDEEFYKNNLLGFKFDCVLELPNAKSIIVIAMPQNITKISFKWRGELKNIVIPPTYISEEADNKALSILESELKAKGYSYIRPKLPLKLLAVRSGLSAYGKNNISYVPEMGSFYKIIAFVTDMPCDKDKDSWRESAKMICCNTCNICANNCPTGCIDAQRFLIHAENCLTNLNEYNAEFPTWVDSKWHNALIGCMDCQIVCPQNKEHINIVEIKDVFEEYEIEAILNNTKLTDLPDKTINTLKTLNLTDYYEDKVLSRNLEVLIND